MRASVVEINLPEDWALYALGDVHGCFDTLISLESKIKKSIKRSGLSNFKMISVGDLCDRGPDTKKVIEHFVNGKLSQTHDVVLGNHEMFFLMGFVGLRPDLVERAGIELSWYHLALTQIYKAVTNQVESWRSNGGDSVFRSYDADIADPNTWGRVPDSHLRLLFDAPLIALTPKAIVSHAVLHQGDLEVLLNYEQEKSAHVGNNKRVLEAVHRCLWERNFPEARIDPKRRQISGHTPVEKVRREIGIGIVQIDTGAVYGRDLTAINLKNFRTICAPSTFHYRRLQRDLYE